MGYVARMSNRQNGGQNIDNDSKISRRSILQTQFNDK
jgi:hypothetical protein